MGYLTTNNTLMKMIIEITDAKIEDDYSITFRDKRTKGRAGGGVQMSFSGDSKKED